MILFTADTAISLTLHQLKEENSNLSNILHNNLQKRISEGLDNKVMTLLRCIKDPETIPSKSPIIYIIHIIYAGNLLL